MSKYKAKRVDVNGLHFDSTVEAEYYKFIVQQYSDVITHPKFTLQEKFISNTGEKIRAIEYEADFMYNNIVVDIKWLATTEAKLKRKMFLKLYPQYELKWIVRYNKQWVDYFGNEKRKRDNKKAKKDLITK